MRLSFVVLAALAVASPAVAADPVRLSPEQALAADAEPVPDPPAVQYAYAAPAMATAATVMTTPARFLVMSFITTSGEWV